MASLVYNEHAQIANEAKEKIMKLSVMLVVLATVVSSLSYGATNPVSTVKAAIPKEVSSLEATVVSSGTCTLQQAQTLLYGGSVNTDALILGIKAVAKAIPTMTVDQLSVAQAYHSKFVALGIPFPSGVPQSYIEWQSVISVRGYDLAKQKLVSGSFSASDVFTVINAASGKNDPARATVLQQAYDAVASSTNAVNGYAYCLLMRELNKPLVNQANMALRVMVESVASGDIQNARNFLNEVAFKQAVKIARAAGRPTVGVVVAEYKALLDSEKSGSGFEAAVTALGFQIPAGWAAGKAAASKVVQDVYSGEIIVPTAAQVASIELYLGTDFAKEFVEKYNKM